jgi:hypothetical protein
MVSGGARYLSNNKNNGILQRLLQFLMVFDNPSKTGNN